MKALKHIKAVAAPLNGANIDTDRIIPARLLRLPRDEHNNYARSLFHDLRFTDDGTEISDFILNRAAWRDSQVLVAGPNFGCGSSRESAVYALLDYGFRVVIAESFGDIFYANCVRNGIAPLKLAEDEAATLRDALLNADDPTVVVDIKALTVTGPDGVSRSVSLPAYMQTRLMEGADEVAITLQRSSRIDAFESRYHENFPWMKPRVSRTTS